MEIFEKEWELNFTQCYANGQLKYSSLNNILQLTGNEHSNLLGYGHLNMLKVKQSWVLSRIVIEIDELPKYTQKILVRTWIQAFNGMRSTRNFEVLLNGKSIIQASSLWVVFNIETRRADQFALDTTNLRVLSDKISTKRATDKIDANIEFNNLSNYQVKLSDLDIVNHANNVKYLDWCFDAMEPEYILSCKIKTLEMNFLRELKFRDEVNILASAKESDNTYAVTKDGNFHFLLRLRNEIA